jgi:hypothetical protein
MTESNINKIYEELGGIVLRRKELGGSVLRRK